MSRCSTTRQPRNEQRSCVKIPGESGWPGSQQGDPHGLPSIRSTTATALISTGVPGMRATPISAGRVGPLGSTRVGAVEFLGVADVLQLYVRVDDMFQRQAGGLDDGLDVFQRLCACASNVAGIWPFAAFAP